MNYFEPEDAAIVPDSDDVFCEDTAGPFFYHSRVIADNENELLDWMDKENYYPNIWFVSDHGNCHPVVFGRERQEE